jgi:simple sugar transport system ATP-binding protein
MSSSDTILDMRGIHKTFPGVVANDRVDFSVREGEIHALLGENGAGKSTLMKVLFGLYKPDAGEVFIRGEPAEIDSPQDAIEAGIGMVHQHFRLIPKLTVTENVVLGLRESYERFHDGDAGSPERAAASRGESGGLLARIARYLTYDQSLEHERVAAVTEEYGIDVDPRAKVWELEVGEQQRVEILKALYRDVDLLILDEPTAALAPNQIDHLFETLRGLVDRGLTVVVITHKLEEITSLTDRVTVLRDGSVVDTVETDRVTETDLARMMVGKDVLLSVDRDPVETGGVVARARDLRATDDRGTEALSGVSLDVHEREILGVAGVSGNGQQELAECLAGVRDVSGGSLELDGTELSDASTQEFVDSGVSYVAVDRHRDGCAPELDLTYNSIVKDYRRERFTAGPLGIGVDYDEARDHAERIVSEYDVRVPSVDVDAGNLSGGNLQKLILGRELVREPKLLVANQPTRGLDVGAIEAVRERILAQRTRGTGVVLISEELDEIMELSDRIAVIYDGELVHTVDAAAADRERIGLYMTAGSAAGRAAPAEDG